MKIQPYMIHVEYDFNSLLSAGTLPVKNIQIVDKVKYDYIRECWYTFNYFRGEIYKHGKLQNEILQTGFKLLEGNIDDVSLYLASIDGNHKRKLYFDENKGIWFELSRFGKKEGKYIRDSGDWVSGVVFSGMVDVLVEENDNVFIEKLVFLPSGILERDYVAMVDDLYRIRQDLIERKKTNVSMSVKMERTPNKIKEILKDIEMPLRHINENPQSELTFAWKPKREEKTTRFHHRTELDKEMNPGRGKYQTFIREETSGIFENKLIKQELLQLKYYCQMYSSSAPLSQTDHEQKINEMNSLIEKSHYKIRRMIKDKEESNYSLLKANIENNITSIKESIEKHREEISDRVKLRVERLSEGYRDVDVTIFCSISAFNLIKKESIFTPFLKTIVKSGWDKDTRRAHLEFAGYSYTVEGKTYSINSESLFLEIVNCSNDLVDHWKLWKALHKTIDSHEMGTNINTKLMITGQAAVNSKDFNSSDIIGKSVEDKPNKEYKFILSSISDITINGESIVNPSNIPDVQEELTGYIMDTDDEVERLKQKLSDEQISLSAINKVVKLDNEKRKLNDRGKVIDEITMKIDELLNLPLFKEVQLDQILPSEPTQLFLHNPSYQTVWVLLQNLQEEVGLSLALESSQRIMRINKVERIYETWCLFKILHILTTELGWSFKESDTAIDCINEFLGKKGKSLNGFKTNLYQGDWRIGFEYEPKIYILEDGKKKYEREKPSFRTPDYFLSFFKNNSLIGHVYLDAKHKNFKEQGRAALTKEIKDTSIEKYGKMVPIEISGTTLGSFIIHSDALTGMENETNGENYYAYYNRDEFPRSLDNAQDNEAHKYGAIYLLPSAIHSFKNLFRMIMEFKIGVHKRCWSCGCEDVHIEQHLTKSGYPKYYLTCSNCEEFWVKVHCSHKGHKIIKHKNNYHRQVLSKFSWYIVCPTCGDGFDVEDASKERY